MSVVVSSKKRVWMYSAVLFGFRQQLEASTRPQMKKKRKETALRPGRLGELLSTKYEPHGLVSQTQPGDARHSPHYLFVMIIIIWGTEHIIPVNVERSVVLDLH